MNIDEVELTTRRQFGSFNTPIAISDLVMDRQDYLLNRRIDRMRYIGWTLLTTGTFSITNADGSVSHTDTFSIQTFTATTPWSTLATSTPLRDLRAVKLLGRGKGVRFDRSATIYLNQTDVNNCLNNTNSADLGGRRTRGGDTINSLASLNQVLLDDDLPTIMPYDEGYLNDAGTFNLFIGAGTGVVKGTRPAGQVIADFGLTRNANNPNLEPGAYMKVVDDPDDVPRLIQVHDGVNMAPRIYYPGSIVKLANLS